MKGDNLAKAIIETMDSSVIITNEKGVIMEVNSNICKTFNLCSEEVYGKSIYLFLSELGLYLENGDNILRDDSKIYEAINKKKIIDNIVLKRFNNKNEDKFYKLKILPLKDNVNGFIISLSDITSNNISKEKLDKAREKYEKMFLELKAKSHIIDVLKSREKQHLLHLTHVIKNISEGLWVLDDTGNVIFHNKAFYEIIGISPMEVRNLNKFYDNYILKDKYGEILSIDGYINNHVKKYVQIRNFVIERINKISGEVRYIELNSTPVFDWDRNMIYTISTIKDITYMKLHEKELEDKTRFIKHVINNLDIPVAVLEYPSFGVILHNKSFEKIISILTGKDYINSSYIKKASFLDLMKEDEKDKIIDIVNKCIINKREYTVSSYKVYQEDEEERIYKIKFKPYLNMDDEVTRIHFHALDITEEAKHNEELERINSLKDEFFTLTSHELRTPLNIISSSLQLASSIYSDDISPNIDKILNRINQNCSRLLKLINNILDLSKAEAGFINVNNINFELVSSTESIVTLANSYAASKGVNLIFDTNLEEVCVSLDKDKYEKVVLNLLSNAVKFTPEGKNIYISLNISEDNVVLSVKDEGIGIPKDKLEIIFDKFAQVNSSLSRRAEGTGLGLSLVKSLVDIMGGEITVNSDMDSGSEFYVTFNSKKIMCDTIDDDSSLTGVRDKIKIEFSDLS
ncbi:PAS domain-containing sensor histidine kinase [Clostridium hydrogeniformans]|uniref:PAS domain-containing sensor histidine kinase n=1 Tax=Clostridium hydrogeniformans TaxID=349933 RepID=UPI00054DD840|nr:PAS domain-containing sensor histidine kinase [Clostridium hydrogeniformans]